MPHMRPSRLDDIPRERELWRMAFGDDWDYIDTYYNYTQDPDWAVVLEDDDGVVQTMLIGFPVDLTLPDGTAMPAIYYYALGTDPAVRGRGYGRDLFRFAEQTFLAQGRSVMTLLPGEPSLYNFFLSIDYDDCNFTMRRLETTPEALPTMSLGSVRTAEISEYNALREHYLKGSFHLTFSDRYVRHQQNVARLYHGDLLVLELGDALGVASVEYADEETLLVKELLAPQGQTEAALTLVAGAFPCKSLVVNLPNLPGFDALGTVEPYGVTHWMLDDEKANLAGRKDGYLGLALD